MAKFENVNCRRYYEENEKEWLRAHYSEYSRTELAERFNALFDHHKAPKTLQRYCTKWLGLHSDRDQYEDIRSEIGSISRNCRGEYLIKTADGWKKLTHKICGKVPKGYVVVHLDGNKDNNSAENLLAVKNGIQTIVRNAGMWSEDAEISRTAFKWAELYDLLKREGINLNEREND